MKKYLLDAGSTVVFTLDMYQDKFAQIADETGLTQVVVADITQSMSPMDETGAGYLKGAKPLPLPSDSRFVRWKEFFAQRRESKTICGNAGAPAVITYTGGTTGGSKGAMLSNKAVLAVGTQHEAGDVDFQRENTFMQVLPLFIAYGLICSLVNPLVVGMTLIVRIPMVESISELYRKFKPNHIIYGPAYWEKFADENDNFDLENLIAPITGGDVLHIETETKINQYLERHGCKYPLLNGYGMTEVGAAVAINYRFAHELGSVGIPFVKTVISAFDVETGEELTYGEQGEICIQAPSMMTAYVNNQAETANVVRKHEDGQL